MIDSYKFPRKTVDPKVEGSSPFGLVLQVEGCQALAFGSLLAFSPFNGARHRITLSLNLGHIY